MDTGAINLTGLSIAALSSQPRAEQLAEKREIVQAVQALNKAEAFGQDQELTFTFDRDSRRTVLKIVNRTTGEVVNQIPAEHVLRLARSVVKR